MIKPILILLTLSHLSLQATSSPEPRRKCVLDADGQLDCVVLSPVTPALRMEERAPCTRQDIKCWCEKAKDYTNDVRRRSGVSKMLKLGTERQMDNAMKYAKKLGGMGFLEHQDLSEATKEVGCQRWVGGENLAFNYETGDIARMCVQQWVDSRGHFENLVRDWFEEVVVGFHFEPDGRVYCVQTFALQFPQGTTGNPTDRGCQPVDRSAPAADEPTRPPSVSSSNPKPSREDKPRPPRDTTTAPLSCRCIRYGKGCRARVAEEAGNGCKGGTQRSKQARDCKVNCCDFCKENRGVGECTHRHVRRICSTV